MTTSRTLAAAPITASLDGPPERPIRFRREFDAGAGIASAELRISALGTYVAELNGVLVHDHVLAPGWTSYLHRLRFQTVDVTDLVRHGANCLAITVAEGWYRGRLGFGGGVREVYGADIGPLAELVVRDRAGGESVVVTTDARWRAAYGPIRFAGLYDGEHVDARLDTPGWSSPGFDDSGWAVVEQLDAVAARLIDQDAPPVRRIDELAVTEVITTPSGRTILDFGQNISGRVRFTVAGGDPGD
jgi:alpha-L-rhamnosidase